LKKAGRMNDAQIAYIQWRIQKHQICIIQRGDRAKILRRIHPPRSLYWKPEYRNFMNFWNQEKPGKWLKTIDFLEKIEKENKERKEFLEIKYAKDKKEEALKKVIEKVKNKINTKDLKNINIIEKEDFIEDGRNENEEEFEGEFEREWTPPVASFD
ncbi:MAG: hypothetical protein AABY22_13650, partial [Nanoarchaeota archaeon]